MDDILYNLKMVLRDEMVSAIHNNISSSNSSNSLINEGLKNFEAATNSLSTSVETVIENNPNLANSISSEQVNPIRESFNAFDSSTAKLASLAFMRYSSKAETLLELSNATKAAEYLLNSMYRWYNLDDIVKKFTGCEIQITDTIQGALGYNLDPSMILEYISAYSQVQKSVAIFILILLLLKNFTFNVFILLLEKKLLRFLSNIQRTQTSMPNIIQCLMAASHKFILCIIDLKIRISIFILYLKFFFLIFLVSLVLLLNFNFIN